MLFAFKLTTAVHTRSLLASLSFDKAVVSIVAIETDDLSTDISVETVTCKLTVLSVQRDADTPRWKRIKKMYSSLLLFARNSGAAAAQDRRKWLLSCNLRLRELGVNWLHSALDVIPRATTTPQRIDFVFYT